jgi:hypothetical protein
MEVDTIFLTGMEFRQSNDAFPGPTESFVIKSFGLEIYPTVFGLWDKASKKASTLILRG